MKPVTWVDIPLGAMAACDFDPKNVHLLKLDDCNGFTKDGELYVYCDIHDHYVHLEKAEDE